MSNTRVDYSELVHALQQNQKGKANALIKELMERLKDYLKVVLNATPTEAEECTQQAFLNVYEQIMQDNIRNEKYIFSYLIKACRHEYFRYAKNKQRFNNTLEDNEEHFVEPAEQVKNLMDEDRQVILEECLDELRDKSRIFIEYFMTHPDSTTKDASKHFNISGANVRTKKSRIINRLHHCFKRKWRQ